MLERVRAGRILLVGVLAVTAGACGSEGTFTGIDLTKQEGDGEVGSWVHSGFYDRTYTLHVPPGGGGDVRPLLIVLHGAGDTGAGFRARIAADAVTDAAGLITVWPDGIAGEWATGCGCTAADLAGANDVIFLNTLVRQLASALPVDTGRVYVVGYSQGGQLAQRYGCTSAHPPAGVATVAATAFRGVMDGCAPAAAFPVAVLHGDRDPVFRYDGFGEGANVLSVAATVDGWMRAMACPGTSETRTVPDDNEDGTTVEVTRFVGCLGGVAVQLDRIRGGGHTWPGKTGPWPKSTGKLSRNLDGTAEILDALMGVRP